jgi:hypothetical protein
MILAVSVILAIAGWIYFTVAELFLGEMTTEEYLELDLANLTPPPSPLPPAPTNEFVATISGILFWILMLGAATAAVVFFLRGRGLKFQSSWLWQIWNKIIGALTEFWHGAMRPIATAAAAIGHQLRRTIQQDQKAATPWRFLSVGRLSTRGQIRYFYLSTVRRAGQRGVKRERSETPLEYAADLKAGWPEVEGAVDDLTEAFQEARYSRKSIGGIEVGRIKQTWKLVRTAVKKRRKNSP